MRFDVLRPLWFRLFCSAMGQSTFGSIVGVVHDKTQAWVQYLFTIPA
jgi:hypothetical protein